MSGLNETHDPARRSWLESANAPDTDFPIQNLPFGIFQREGAAAARGGVAIGDQVFDLSAGLAAGLFTGAAAGAAALASGPTLNPLMALGNAPASALRAQLSDLLRADAPERSRVEGALLPMREVTLHLPAAIGAFTDFFTSVFHAERGGRQRNPDQPLTPNFKHIPIAYSGRAGSIGVSGEAFRRPNGQYREDGALRFGPEPRLDFELEVGALLGPGNARGRPIPLTAAREHIFGYCLVNDWSARAIQAWETVPAGPFQGKSFCTTVSPWVVTGEALAPFHCAAFARGADDPTPLPYLDDADDARSGGIDLGLEAYIETPRMRAEQAAPARITRTNLTTLYWTFGQMVTYHASNGCNFAPGDLIASGTTSGASDESRACLNELCDYGRADIVLPNGETRRYLQDGDAVILRARAERDGYVPIGFGECRGRVEPALP